MPASVAGSSATAARRSRGLGLGLGLLSFVVLAYEVTELRVFAYALNPLLVYAVIAITMLGLGVASTALALSGRLAALPLRRALGACCLLMVLSGLLANLLFARLSPRMASGAGGALAWSTISIAVSAACTLPFACGGFAVALLLSRRAARAGHYYGCDLLGSGLGCFAVVGLLRPLGAERLLLVLLGCAALAGALLAGPRQRWTRGANLLVAAALWCVSPWAPQGLHFTADPGDQLAAMARAYRQAGEGSPRVEHLRWDPVARVQVSSWPGTRARLPAPVRYKILTQDGGAASLLLATGDDPRGGAGIFGATAYGAAFSLHPGGRVLLIGMGGAPDVQAALHHGATHITAVEINAAIAEVTRSRFADFIGRPLDAPGVELAVSEGRSFVRGSGRHYDVVEISGADTLTLQASGAFVLAEEYLYTVEAFEDYLRALRPGGLVSVLRFAREPYRLSAIAAAALRRLGANHPERHVVVLGQALLKIVLIKRQPWRAAELDAVERLVRRSGAANRGIELLATDMFGLRLGAPLELLYAPAGRARDAGYRALFSSLARGEAAGEVIPTDDRPYYFGAEWVHYLRGQPTPPGVSGLLDTYLRFTIALGLLALAFIAAPAVAWSLRRRRPARPLALVCYFGVLGAGFMTVEIALIQKTALALGHPSYAVAVALAALLSSSAAGARLSDRWRAQPRRLAIGACLVVAALGVVEAAWLGTLLDTVMGLALPWRATAVALCIAPLGVAMGTLLPTGLRLLRGQRRPQTALAWAIAASALASVLGTTAALPLAVLLGFSALLGGGAAFYLLAAAACWRLAGQIEQR